MAFPTTSVLDDFNRANGALGSNWTNDPFGTTQPAPAITSNAVTFGTFGCAAWWNPGTFGADSEVFCTVATKPANGTGFLQLLARIQTPGSTAGDAYKAELSPATGTDTVDVYRVINGVDTAVGSVSQEFNAGDKVGMEVTGTGATVTIKIFRHDGVSWAQVGASISDTNAARIVTAGNIGLGCFQSTATAVADDFGGGTLAAGGGATVTAVPMAGSGDIVAPVVSGTGLLPPVMAGTGDLVAPAVSGSGSATVTALVMAGTGDLVSPSVAAGATIVAVPMGGTGAFPPANGIVSVEVLPGPMSGTGGMVAPAVSGGGSATVTALPMAATGDLVAPLVFADAAVTSVVMAGTGDVVAPAVAADAAVVALPMAGTGDLVAPVISAGGGVTVTVVPMSGVGDLVAPLAIVDAVVLGVRMLATGALVAPSVSGTSSATVLPPVMAGAGDLVAPLVSAQGSGTVSATRM
jgi:hypothetical protein